MRNIENKLTFSATFCDEFGNKTSFETTVSPLTQIEEMLSAWKRAMAAFGWTEESIEDAIIQESFLIQDREK